jgi:dTDP-4-dehydrorhamnose 3,5-epimerase
MELREMWLIGAYTVDLSLKSDHRGCFARTFCAREFEAHGLRPTVAQCNIAFNHVCGTIRGMHFQIAPSRENLDTVEDPLVLLTCALERSG